EVLRERTGGENASWDRIVANCLQGANAELDDAALQEMFSIVADPERLGEFMSAVERIPDSRGVGARTAALLRLLQTVIERLGKKEPEQVEKTLDNVASAVGRLSPEMLMGLLA